MFDWVLNTTLNIFSFTNYSHCIVMVQKKPPLVFFFKKGILRNFTIFTGKNLCWSLFLIKLPVWSPQETPIQMFSSKYCEIFKNSYFKEHLQTAASDGFFIQFVFILATHSKRWKIYILAHQSKYLRTKNLIYFP